MTPHDKHMSECTFYYVYFNIAIANNVQILVHRAIICVHCSLLPFSNATRLHVVHHDGAVVDGIRQSQAQLMGPRTLDFD